MNARQKAHAELQHALDALTDGSGHEEWGPGPVGHELWGRSEVAGYAFDRSAQIALNAGLMGAGIISPAYRTRFIESMRRLAPVILDIRLDAQGVE